MRTCRNLPLFLTLLLLGLALPLTAQPTASGEKLVLHFRTRIETAKDSGRWHTVMHRAEWDPKKTAIVICDMWDKHWCEQATRRVAEMAPRMNEVVQAARKRGMLIIHCPSDTMDFYKDTPQRQLAQQAPVVETTVPLQRWCRLDPQREPPLPIDDADNGCDDPMPAQSQRVWSRQIATIEIREGDAITDSAEAYYLMRQRGIDNVIVMGVHTNMCVLGRPFSIRQMVYQGKNVVLMRDLTDAMYNPRRRPFVSHFTGTDLVVEHIEKYWCPTITSVAFLGGQPFRFKDDKRPHLAVLIGEDEYQTNRTLPDFAVRYLGKDFRVSFIFASEQEPRHFPGLEMLPEADVLLLSVRRRTPPQAQLDFVRQFVATGKPVVGIRTACHAFELAKGAKPAAGFADWPRIDRELFGCNYVGHHDSKNAQTFVRRAAGAATHPILNGIPTDELLFRSWLYKVVPLHEKATPLLMGRVEGVTQEEPVAWTFTHAGGGRVFYTSLGHADDFQVSAFRRLLLNGIYWSAGLTVPDKAAVE